MRNYLTASAHLSFLRCHHCQELSPELDAAADHLATKNQFVFAKVSCALLRPDCVTSVVSVSSSVGVSRNFSISDSMSRNINCRWGCHAVF